MTQQQFLALRTVRISRFARNDSKRGCTSEFSPFEAALTHLSFQDRASSFVLSRPRSGREIFLLRLQALIFRIAHGKDFSLRSK